MCADRRVFHAGMLNEAKIDAKATRPRPRPKFWPRGLNMSGFTDLRNTATPMLVILRLIVFHDFVMKKTSASVSGTLMVCFSSSIVRHRPSLSLIGHVTRPRDPGLSSHGKTLTEWAATHPSDIPIRLLLLLLLTQWLWLWLVDEGRRRSIRYSKLTLWRPLSHCCHMGTAIKHPVWRSALSVRVPGCQKYYKWRLNPVWHRMLYSCTHMVAVAVKGLTRCL